MEWRKFFQRARRDRDFAGIAAAYAAGRFVQTLLSGVQPGEPAVMPIAAAVLLLAAAGAAILPAWRASRIDPMQALRPE